LQAGDSQGLGIFGPVRKNNGQSICSWSWLLLTGGHADHGMMVHPAVSFSKRWHSNLAPIGCPAAVVPARW